MPPKTELILSPFSPASPGILDHDLPLVAKRRGPRDDQIVPGIVSVYTDARTYYELVLLVGTKSR